MEDQILVLGAGPSGMACAMELSKSNKTSLIIEKENSVGGFAKTLEFKDQDLSFRTDIGPHRFFSKNPYLYEFIEELLGKDWILVKRQTRQLIDGKFYDYPVNALQAFKNIELDKSIRMGFSYLFALLKYGLAKKQIVNFEDYVIANFGRSLGEFNILNYTEKIWGLPCNQIHPDWAKQRIKGLSLFSTLKAAFKKNNGARTLVESFFYPRYGMGSIYEEIANRVTKSGSKLEIDSCPTKIFHNNGKITKVDLMIKGKSKSVEPSHLISSIPITEFISILSPAPSKEVTDAIANLKWRSQVYLFITLNKEKITDDNWIYFPCKDIPFARVAEMKNFSKEMSPADKTSLFIEFFVNEEDKIWNMDKDELFNFAMPYFERLNLFKKGEVRNYYLFKKTHVYPIYDLNYSRYLEIIKKYLNQFENLFYIGRPGRFHYTNQDHSLEMGILAAKSIIENRRYELDDIGNDDEYFEKGFIKDVKN